MSRFWPTLLLYLAAATAVAETGVGESADRERLREFLRQTIGQADSFEDRFDAEVWLVDMSARLARFVSNPQRRLELLRQIHSAHWTRVLTGRMPEYFCPAGSSS